MKKSLLIFLAAALCFCFIGGAEAAKDASPEPSMKTVPKEVKMGKKVSAQVEKDIPRVLDPAEEARLAVIAAKLTPYLQRNLNYEVRIIDMKEPNAFSLPGGMTYITTGMLKFLKSDAEIAAVLAHEFVHADRAHVIVQSARSSRLDLMTIAGIAAAIASGNPGAAVMTQAVQTAVINQYSIELEKEADARGIEILRRAGFNPAAMLTMMERLEVERLRHAYVDPGIFQTHPEVKERVAAALKYMEDNGIEVQRKDVVGSLSIDAVEVSGDERLTIDGTALLSVQQSPEAKKLFKSLKKRFDETLELELAPYDIQVSGSGEELLIRGRSILAKKELLPGMPTLSALRDLINDAIQKARRENPLANYFK